ncbi:DUF4123 domain-containing protein [Cupriavidus neocaledonicus]|uniref:DUF4123 domain-containing protein n=1 Tax=Cupriavidus neocaledonicus TaxID=1040979 RepID=A0A375GZS0_9BURK|nr:DUF4123 domain-containing protein [Cupriavidus neocaledonicus]SOZ34154.1 conserved hypothetical protein [Cupriavidus neocaledonicus]SPD45081.1 conserved protein of unknown function [Cupriavidus neocaledonicus]
MYYAVESRDPGIWLDGLLRRIDGAPGVHWSALIDGVFDHEGKPFAAPVHRYPLYGDTGALCELVPASPYLLPLDGMASVERRALLAALGTHCQGRPMLSFVASWQSAERLVKLWQPCLQPVIAGDDTPYLLRFADTRVLSALPVVLSLEGWNRLTAPLAQWHLVNRQGGLDVLALTEPRAELEAYRDEPLMLSQEELDRMLDAAMPDAVLDLMYREALLPDIGKAEAYRLVARCCEVARMHQAEAAPDIALLALYAMAKGEASLEGPEFLQWLAGSRQSGSAWREYLLSALGDGGVL